MRVLRVLVLSASLVFAFSMGCLSATSPKDLQKEEWMTFQLANNKVGYIHTTVVPVQFNGKAAYRLDEFTRARMKAGSIDCQIESTVRFYISDQFDPLMQVTTVHTKNAPGDKSSDDSTSISQLSFMEKAVECDVTENGKTKHSSVQIPDGADLKTYCKFALGALKLSVGDKLKLTFFDPDEQTFRTSDTGVLRQEKLDMNGHTYDALVMSNSAIFLAGSMVDCDATAYVSDHSDLIKVELEQGAISIVTASKDEALKGEDAPANSLDFLQTIPADKVISDPQNVKQLKVCFKNILNKDQFRTCDYQTVEYDAEAKTATCTVKSCSFDHAKSVMLPVKGKEFSKWLGAEDGIETNDKAIIEKSREIIGNEKSAYKAACRLAEWLYDNIGDDKDAESVPDSAVATLKAKNGVCRHNALLYTALARAAGIPTRILTGLVYDGGFARHAWAESYVGEWLPVDPTRGSDFVDATHIAVTGYSLGAEKLDLSVKAQIIDYVSAKVADKPQAVSESDWTAATSPGSGNREEWMGLYIGDRKVGYSHKTTEIGKFGQKEAFKWTYKADYHYVTGGVADHRNYQITFYIDKATFQPIMAHFFDSKDTDLYVTFNGQNLVLKGRSAGDDVDKTVRVSPGFDMSNYCKYELGKLPMSVGQTIPLDFFSPYNCKPYYDELKVLRRENVEVDGQTYNAFVTENTYPKKEIRWRTENAIDIKDEIEEQQIWWPRSVKVTGKPTDIDSTGPWTDLNEVHADKTIDNGDVIQLKVRIVGIPDSDLVMNQFRQSVKYSPQTKTAEYSIDADLLDSSHSLKLPITGDEAKKWLSETDGVQVNDAAIQKQAWAIVADEKNAYMAACKIRSWVHDYLTYSTTDVPTNSAVEILKSKKANCWQYNILYVALARAAGIPSRFVGGLSYFDGTFNYVTWPESYVGEWVPLDPWEKSDFIDATHIKFQSGEADDISGWFYPLLSAEIVDYKLKSSKDGTSITVNGNEIKCPAGSTIKVNKDGSCVIEQK